MSRNGQKAEASGNATSRIVDSLDQMMRLPFQMTGATWDLMVQGMQSVSRSGDARSASLEHTSSSSNLGTNSSWSMGDRSSSANSQSSGSSWTSTFSGQNDQDLSGDDLKYVIWSIVFTKPGLECVLEPQHEEIVNYSADGSSFAAVKIAKLLEKARHGHVEKPDSWRENSYPSESPKTTVARTDTTTVISTAPGADLGSSKKSASASSSHDQGWRIPADDQKYLKFLYRVDRRLPRQEAEVIERVTIERGTKIV